ncbi:hypothetical protein [Vibrio navarrensis]|uniref:hypothetical protein n=1 Tax=Vibrio navarrensis TaxID=29495 RepID=UPI0018DD3A2F|nr:hypothetical protein [Vibrio navarrensis]MBH9739923.1 hypothetical protein [Vibrio navarrensis]HDY8122784.1 hypothetical protein [Vibrio vulnificus]
MTFEEYKQLIDCWTKNVNSAGITLSDGKSIPFTFWKTFLGMTRKQHQDMYRGTFKNKTGCVPKYVVQAIRFARKLEHDVFLEEVRIHLPLFEKDKVS